MTEIIDIRSVDDPRDVIHQAVLKLADGEVIGVPTEVGYALVANPLRPEAVEQLKAAAGESRLSLGLRDMAEIHDYIPKTELIADRLVRRCWPGPVILEFVTTSSEGLINALPKETAAALRADDSLRLVCSCNEIIQSIGRLLPAPLVLAFPEHRNEPVRSASGLSSGLPFNLPFAIDSGPPRFDGPATVVRIDGGKWDVTQEGVVSRQSIARLTSQMIVFVCTGNTCRSPMAEGLFRKFLGERLQLDNEDELFGRGFLITSAGIAAVNGAAASPESVEAARSAGADISGHLSRPLTRQMIYHADRIFTMTRGHFESIVASFPEAAEKTELLARDGRDICDPFGQDQTAYDACRRDLEESLRILVEELTRAF